MVNIIIGTRFCKLTVVNKTINPNDKRSHYLCLCDCGKEAIVRIDNLKTGNTRSCGCMLLRHGMTNSLTYRSWNAMLDRCTNIHHNAYKNYGARGITVCTRWYDFRNFLEDMGERPLNKTLDRIDNDGNYEPSNCRWATIYEQIQNSRIRVRA